jgi:hypothetical protein
MINGHITLADGTGGCNPEVDHWTHLIRKLRWMGLDEEADRLERSLLAFAPEQRSTVLADPLNTD